MTVQQVLSWGRTWSSSSALPVVINNKHWKFRSLENTAESWSHRVPLRIQGGLMSEGQARLGFREEGVNDPRRERESRSQEAQQGAWRSSFWVPHSEQRWVKITGHLYMDQIFTVCAGRYTHSSCFVVLSAMISSQGCSQNKRGVKNGRKVLSWRI